ncbi:endoplasmic reticulum Oxidoreductin 1-domain-containing protein [Pseudomassariella vexata]|uniref:Endoplasmic reticulum Oxidoreductin 1-domain-containing protein n=1 Tax=Pseudomassariella vexata TaxID=1141098 RepID=A0A1Y2D5M1_9PEZI|nr:endoplasmic reticulum Oxidoreductin 1-domain-containing protein [Pseudomassariella vexata]ORY54550.1 endoplasmic reticulum Oxidoreductin 1-domain-containing protein [Pseudomassariella vexata]
MKPAAKLFYLSLFALWGTPVQCESKIPDETCAISPKAIVSDACASYSTLEKLNSKVRPHVDDLTQQTDFFSYYRLNLFKEGGCPFWNDENGMCANIACKVDTLDKEEDIPKIWRAAELGKLEGPVAKHPGKTAQKERPQRPLQGSLGENVGESCVVEADDECDERDYCVPEDESVTAKGDYVSLIQNPERFTGYAGDGANMVWDAIYRENCFQKSSFPHTAALGMTSVPRGPAAFDFRAVLQDAGRQQMLEQQVQQGSQGTNSALTGLGFEDECLEKRVFYRVISGMHASISTHLCWDFLNQTTGQWQPNTQCYIHRLHMHPERISNLYFNYALVTRAIAKIGPQLRSYTFCTGDDDQDAATKAKVLAVTEGAAAVPHIFDESLMFKNGEGPSLKEDFRNRFRNVSRIMDCVGCDKCRLWGKLQTAGYGAALKILFEFDNNKTPGAPELKRTELVALFNTYARLSSSMSALTEFRSMVEAAEAAEEDDHVEIVEGKVDAIPDRAKKPHAVATSTDEEEKKNKDEQSDEWEGQEEPSKKKKKPAKDMTIKEVFKDELKNVIRAFKLVLKGWVQLPRNLWYIFVTELNRAWEYYIGLPVSPRTWRFERPRMDEL